MSIINKFSAAEKAAFGRYHKRQQRATAIMFAVCLVVGYLAIFGLNFSL